MKATETAEEGYSSPIEKGKAVHKSRKKKTTKPPHATRKTVTKTRQKFQLSTKATVSEKMTSKAFATDNEGYVYSSENEPDNPQLPKKARKQKVVKAKLKEIQKSSEDDIKPLKAKRKAFESEMSSNDEIGHKIKAVKA